MPLSHVCRISSQQSNMTSRALAKDKECFYQVSPSHYGDETFLRDALKRYKNHLLFKQKTQNAFLVPCYMTLTLSGMPIK